MPNSADYAALKAAGRCPICRQPNADRFVTCDTCRGTHKAAESERIFQRTGSRKVVAEARIRDIEAHMDANLEGRLEKLAALMKKLAVDLEQSDAVAVDETVVHELHAQWERLKNNFEEPDAQKD